MNLYDLQPQAVARAMWRAALLGGALAGALAAPARAQSELTAEPPIAAGAPSSPLGRQDGLAPGETVLPAPKSSRRSPAQPPNGMPPGLGFDAGTEDVERVIYRHGPLRVLVQPGRERLISFPGPVALHTPEGLDALVRIQIIERTAYLKALAPFESVRVVAEDLNTGRQIPLDLVAQTKPTSSVQAPLEIILNGQRASSPPGGDVPAASAAADGPSAEGLDMIALTRYAAQSLYAPRRLIPTRPGVRSIPVRGVSVDGLYRGWRVRTTPIGAWRSGQLYVTAVRFDNEGSTSHDIDPGDVRGQWLAATPQHRRLLPAGSDWDSTTVYLVCDRPFDACREQ